MPLQQQTLAAGTEVSRYRVERLVARGGMGLVYRAWDVRLDRPVALKVLSPELSDDERFRERFVRESRLAAAVDHPNVIPVYEAEDWQGLLYLAMRFVDGVDLHTVLAASGRVDPPAALHLLAQAAGALDAAHRLGLVHRDVKPGNFMLAGADADRVPPDTHVYLTDFGLTKRASSVSGLTRTGQFLGSLHYVAPEQIRGEDVDARTDIYALACVAFEMLAGRPAFDMDGEAGLLWAHMSADPPSLAAVRPNLPEALDHVLARAMAKDPADRPSSCAELFGGIRWALGGTQKLSVPGQAGALRPSRESDATTPASGTPSSGEVHPSFPRGSAPSTVQQGRPQVPLGGSIGGPPGDGGGSEGSPPGSSPSAPSGDRAASWWRRRRALLAGLAAVLAVLLVGLLVWSPWSGPSLVGRDFVVVPYRAEVPEDWQQTTETVDGTFTEFGVHEWTGLLTGDEAVVAQAEHDLTEEPESLVHLYVDPSDSVDADTPAEAVEQLQGVLPSGGRLVEQGTREVAGREGLAVSGVVPVGESGQLRVYAVVIKDDPRMVMVFLCPPALYDEWRPTFDRIVDSVQFTG